MALLDAYATYTEYRAAVADAATGADATLIAQLLGCSRLLERSLKVMPGAWNTHTGTYVFDGSGTPKLRLRSTEGLGYFLQTITADSLKIDTDLDGSYDDYTLDLADAWVRGLPANAAAHSEPFTALELRPLSSATITVFPALPGCIQIVGTWGWAAVPQLVKDLVIHRTHELREAHVGGAIANLPDFEGGAPLQPKTFWMWKEAERLYGRKQRAVFA